MDSSDDKPSSGLAAVFGFLFDGETRARIQQTREAALLKTEPKEGKGWVN